MRDAGRHRQPTVPHQPVMVREVVELLAASKPEVVVDFTAGFGGHAAALLAAGAGRRAYVAIDRDPAAVAATRRRLRKWGARAVAVHAPFSQCDRVLDGLGIAHAHAMLADLGVSSPQLDDPSRGFSFRLAGPLDMRMDPTAGRTLDAWLRQHRPETLARVLRDAEVPTPGRVARAIVEAHRASKLHTTADLAAVIEAATPARARRGRIHPATLAFQALRMAVNRELAELDALLTAAPRRLAPGGVLVVIAFHSLEDRRVKRRFRALAADGFEVVTRKPLRPGPGEVAANPRSRSARLRAIRRPLASNQPARGGAS